MSGVVCVGAQLRTNRVSTEDCGQVCARIFADNPDWNSVGRSVGLHSGSVGKEHIRRVPGRGRRHVPARDLPRAHSI